MENQPDFGCSMCSFVSKSEKHVTKHICLVHRDDPRFLVHCACFRSFKKWNTFLKHLQRGCSARSNPSSHSSLSLAPVINMTGFLDQDFHQSQNAGRSTMNGEILDSQWQQAEYILSIKEKYGLTQVAVDHVISSTKLLLKDVLTQLLYQMSHSNHLSTNGQQYLEEECNRISDQLFHNLSTRYMQQKYFKDHFNFIVWHYNGQHSKPFKVKYLFFPLKEPRTTTLGTSLKWKKVRGKQRIVRKKISFQ